MAFISIRNHTKLITTDKCLICHGTGESKVGATVTPCVACEGTGRASISVGELVDYIDAELGARENTRGRM